MSRIAGKTLKVKDFTILKDNRRIAMPWKVSNKKTKKGWPIYKKENGRWKVVGYSASKAKAQASVRARYASEYGDMK